MERDHEDPEPVAAPAPLDRTLGVLDQRNLPIDLDDFNRRIVLAYSGKPRNSGINNWEVTKAHIDGDRAVFKNFERIAAIAHALRAALAKPDWDEAGRLIREEWSHRRKNAPGITTEFIDRLVASAKRASRYPDVPTLEELGMRVDADTTFGVYAPAGVSAAIIERMNREINRTLNSPALVDNMAKLGGEVAPLTIQEFVSRQAADRARYGAFIKEAGIKVD